MTKTNKDIGLSQNIEVNMSDNIYIIGLIRLIINSTASHNYKNNSKLIDVNLKNLEHKFRNNIAMIDSINTIRKVNRTLKTKYSKDHILKINIEIDKMEKINKECNNE